MLNGTIEFGAPPHDPGGPLQLVAGRVSHHGRDALTRPCPVLVTVDVKPGVPSLRRKDVFRGLLASLERLRQLDAFHITHWTLRASRLELIVEVDDQAALSRGMQSLNTSLAKQLNRIAGRSGAVLEDRYASSPLTSPRERDAVELMLRVSTSQSPHDAFVSWYSSQMHPATVTPPRPWVAYVSFRLAATA
jgi:hypothetical protein